MNGFGRDFREIFYESTIVGHLNKQCICLIEFPILFINRWNVAGLLLKLISLRTYSAIFGTESRFRNTVLIHFNLIKAECQT